MRVAGVNKHTNKERRKGAEVLLSPGIVGRAVDWWRRSELFMEIFWLFLTSMVRESFVIAVAVDCLDFL